MVPSVEPGTPPNRGACPVAWRTPRTMARTSGSLRSTRVARRNPLTACHSTVAPGTASMARWQATSISLATASPSGPGVSRTSSVAWATEGMTLDWGTPCTGACTMVGVTVGGRRWGLRRHSRRSWRSSAGTSRSKAPSALMGLTPASGIAPWAMRPRAVTRAHTTPRCSRQSSFCSGSQMIAAVSARPSAVVHRCLAPSMSPSSSTSAPTTRRPPSRAPLRLMAAAAIIAAASPLFMSALPRP